MKFRYSLFLAVALFSSKQLSAQENLTSAGGDYSGSSGSISYSVGQIAYLSENNSDYSISEGVQQPFEISQILSLIEAKNIEISLAVFPNPTYDIVKIELKNDELNNYKYQLTDLIGNIIEENKLFKKEVFVDLSKLPKTSYLLKISLLENQKEIKIVKISKL